MPKMSSLILIFCICASGCFAAVHKPRAISEVEKTVSVEVLRSDILAKGGTVNVEPFKAGPDAEATSVLDRFALQIVSAAAEMLRTEGGRLLYKSPDNAGEADFLIEGHVEQFKTPGTMDKLMLKHDISVRIAANLRDVKSGQVIALIFDQRKIENKPKMLDAAGYAIGVDMIRALLNTDGKI